MRATPREPSFRNGPNRESLRQADHAVTLVGSATESGRTAGDLAATPVLQRARGDARIVVEQRGAAERLGALRQSGCLKLRLPRVPKGRPREAVLINTAGGLTGGDRLAVEASASERSRLVLASQTAERLYRASHGEARVEVRLSVGEGARLAWLPQETIAFEGSALRRALTVDLHPTARFLAIESLVLGRLAMGERVERAHFRDEWRVRVGNQLVHAEALQLGPDTSEWIARPSVLHGAVALATVLYVGPDAAHHLAHVRNALGNSGAADVHERHPRLIARTVAADGFELRRRLVPVLAHLNAATMGLGCDASRQGDALPAVWSL